MVGVTSVSCRYLVEPNVIYLGDGFEVKLENSLASEEWNSAHLDSNSAHLDSNSAHLDGNSVHLDNNSTHLDSNSARLGSNSAHLDSNSANLDNLAVKCDCTLLSEPHISVLKEVFVFSTP